MLLQETLWEVCVYMNFEYTPVISAYLPVHWQRHGFPQTLTSLAAFSVQKRRRFRLEKNQRGFEGGFEGKAMPDENSVFLAFPIHAKKGSFEGVNGRYV